MVPYHILLGRPWLHKHQLIPSTYHQCVKGRLNGKPIRIAANPMPFDQSESHFVEAALYDEVAPAGEASLAKPVGIPLPKWEEIKDAPETDLRDLLEQKKKCKAEASTSKSQPQCVRVRLPDFGVFIYYRPNSTFNSNRYTYPAFLAATPFLHFSPSSAATPQFLLHLFNQILLTLH